MHELTIIGRKYTTDKATAPHNYTELVYGPHFEKRKNDKINLLEIGIGRAGPSHKMWKEYFTNGNIYCFDPFHLPQAGTIAQIESFGIKAIKGNQLNREDLHRAGRACPGLYDFIIDDGAHLPDAMQISLGVLFPYLKSGGYYIVEDLKTATRRGKYLEESNEVLQTTSLQEVHVKEVTLQNSLEHYRENQQWLSNVLHDDEKQYLSDNILKWQFYNEKGGKQNLCVIWKK